MGWRGRKRHTCCSSTLVHMGTEWKANDSLALLGRERFLGPQKTIFGKCLFQVNKDQQVASWCLSLLVWGNTTEVGQRAVTTALRGKGGKRALLMCPSPAQRCLRSLLYGTHYFGLLTDLLNSRRVGVWLSSSSKVLCSLLK